MDTEKRKYLEQYNDALKVGEEFADVLEYYEKKPKQGQKIKERIKNLWKHLHPCNLIP